VLVGVNILVTTVGEQTLGMYVLLGQLLIVATALGGLYFVLQEVANHRQLNRRLTQAAHHRDQLDAAKNQAIELIAEQLGEKYDTLKQETAEIIASGQLGSKQLAGGLKQLQKVVEVMKTLSIVQTAEVNVSTVDVQQEIVGDLIDRLQALEDKKVIIDEQLEVPQITTDPRLFSSVVASLVDNAIAFSPDGGRLTLASITSDEGEEFIICDQGPGMPKEINEQVLQPFTHPGDEMTETHQGLGLSLYLDMLIMRHLQGEMHFERAENGGTIVRLKLPAQEQPAE
jgi:K+-sensing histidine kinase KdpD